MATHSINTKTHILAPLDLSTNQILAAYKKHGVDVFEEMAIALAEMRAAGAAPTERINAAAKMAEIALRITKAETASRPKNATQINVVLRDPTT